MKKKKSTMHTKVLLSPEIFIQQKSRNLPISRCFISENWKKIKMCQVFITREHANGDVAFCSYFVDLLCLGIKDTLYRSTISVAEVEKVVKGQDGVKYIEVPYELVHNIIYAGLEFAEEFGFKPHKNFTSTTRYFLEEDTDDIPLIEIECGDENGNPFYINTGMDSPARIRQILDQLEKTAGRGNYSFELYDDDRFPDADIKNDPYDKVSKKIAAQVKRMTAEERKNLFLQMQSGKGITFPISEEDTMLLMELTNAVAYDIVDNKELTKQLDIVKKKFPIVVEDDKLPNSLIVDLPQNIDKETFFFYFYDIIEGTIYNKHKDMEVVIETFREIVGDLPIVCFAELFYLNYNDDKRYEKKLKEYAKKYPGYFLIQVYLHENPLGKRGIPTIKEIEKLLSNRKYPLTKFELNIFFPVYALWVACDDYLELSEILAIDKYMKKIFLTNNSREMVLSLLGTPKVSRICDYFRETGDLKPFGTDPLATMS